MPTQSEPIFSSKPYAGFDEPEAVSITHGGHREAGNQRSYSNAPHRLNALLLPVMLIHATGHWLSLLLCYEPRFPREIEEAGR